MPEISTAYIVRTAYAQGYDWAGVFPGCDEFRAEEAAERHATGAGFLFWQIKRAPTAAEARAKALFMDGFRWRQTMQAAKAGA